MLEALKVIILGIVEGITEWLPISSTGHLILVEKLINMDTTGAFWSMFNVVIQLGAIMAVVVIYFHKLNPFSNTKTQKQKMLTIQLWVKVLIASVPAAIIGLLFDDFIDKHFMNYVVVALMLIVYGVLFIVVEKRHEGVEPKIKRLSDLDLKTVALIGVFQVLALIPGTSRSGATIIGGLLLGASRSVAAEFTFFLAIPVMFGASLLKVIKLGFAISAGQFFLLILGCVVSFGVSYLAIKFLMSYIKKNDFKVFGYYRIVLGIIVLLYFGITALF
ncbi:MAG: undecaprenyl-diphosphate phosphatase [Hespellia sp.]|nr:undecaprenyl-diphosphate phosphatase [Hespellia sp.]